MMSVGGGGKGGIFGRPSGTTSVCLSPVGLHFIHNLDEVRRDAKTTENAFKQFGRTLKRVTMVLIAFKISNTVINGFKNLGKAALSVNEEFEKAQVQMKVFTGSSLEAAHTMEHLLFESTKLAGGLRELVNASTALSTFGMNIDRWLGLAADTAQAVGRTVDDVVIAFGRVLAGDMRTKQFIVTRRGDLTTFNRVLRETGDRALALEDAFEKFRGVSKELEGTWHRLSENFNDIFLAIMKVVGEPVFDAMKSVLFDIVNGLRGSMFDEHGAIRIDSVWKKMADTISAVGRLVKGAFEPLIWAKDVLRLIANMEGKESLNIFREKHHKMSREDLIRAFGFEDFKPEENVTANFFRALTATRKTPGRENYLSRFFREAEQKDIQRRIDDLNVLLEREGHVLFSIGEGIKLEDGIEDDFNKARSRILNIFDTQMEVFREQVPKMTAGLKGKGFSDFTEVTFDERELREMSKTLNEMTMRFGASEATGMFREDFLRGNIQALREIKSELDGIFEVEKERGLTESEARKKIILLNQETVATEELARATSNFWTFISDTRKMGFQDMEKFLRKTDPFLKPGDYKFEEDDKAADRYIDILNETYDITKANREFTEEINRMHWEGIQKRWDMKQEEIDKNLKAMADYWNEEAKMQEDANRKYLAKMERFVSRIIPFVDIFSNRENLIDKQVEALERELRVLNGLEEPLTREEVIQQRILELESQRLSIIGRMSNAFRDLANEIANAAIKAAALNAILTATGRGGGTGGFWGIFRTMLGIGAGIATTVVTGNPLAGVAVSSGFGAAVGSGPGIGTDRAGGIGIPSPKPTVQINNPVFIGQDAVSLVEQATTRSGRRVIYA